MPFTFCTEKHYHTCVFCWFVIHISLNSFITPLSVDWHEWRKYLCIQVHISSECKKSELWNLTLCIDISNSCCFHEHGKAAFVHQGSRSRGPTWKQLALAATFWQAQAFWKVDLCCSTSLCAKNEIIAENQQKCSYHVLILRVVADWLSNNTTLATRAIWSRINKVPQVCELTLQI